MLSFQNRIALSLAAVPLLCAGLASAADTRAPLFLTATNGSTNYLATMNTRTHQTSYIPTGGNGGASGNAGGIAVNGEMAAVINNGSRNVTIFVRVGDAMQPMQLIKTLAAPLSVTFGQSHLVVLETTLAESFPMFGNTVMTPADGSSPLQLGDGSAAQIVAFNGGVIYSEKTGSVAELSLSTDGAPGLSGPNVVVPLPPAPNNNTPFGIVARDSNVYLTIAHSDIEALVQNGKIVAMAEGPMPFMVSGNIIHAPCWNTLSGQFLFASDSPGQQILRYLVSDAGIFLDKIGVAALAGAPTDLFADGNLLAVIDGGNGSVSNASVFEISSEGELTLLFAVKIPSPINGAVIVN
jgi:hypothetical protein